MKEWIVNYFRKIGSLMSQTANVILLDGHTDESISARTYRNASQGKPVWIRAEKVINFLFRPFEKDHCKKAFEVDMERAKELIRNWTRG